MESVTVLTADVTKQFLTADLRNQFKPVSRSVAGRTSHRHWVPRYSSRVAVWIGDRWQLSLQAITAQSPVWLEDELLLV